MLKIVKSTEPMNVANIVLTLYSAPGYGKSTLGFTADRPLMLDFDKGAYRAANRGDAVSVSKWSDVESMTADDLAPYQTIIIDTAGRALDAMGVDIIARNPKMGRNGGSLSLQGFGELKGRFSQWQSFLRSLGKDLVLICHMEEQKNGDDILERIDAQGSSKNEIYKSSDAMCRIQIQPDGTRVLNFDPREGGFGKNPAQLPVLKFPHPSQNPHFLADVIQSIKDSINKLTGEQAEAVKEEQDLAEAIKGAKTVDHFNTLLGLARERKYKTAQRAAIAEAAKAHGFDYMGDKLTGKFAAAV